MIRMIILDTRMIRMIILDTRMIILVVYLRWQFEGIELLPIILDFTCFLQYMFLDVLFKKNDPPEATRTKTSPAFKIPEYQNTPKYLISFE